MPLTLQRYLFLKKIKRNFAKQFYAHIKWLKSSSKMQDFKTFAAKPRLTPHMRFQDQNQDQDQPCLGLGHLFIIIDHLIILRIWTELNTTPLTNFVAATKNKENLFWPALKNSKTSRKLSTVTDAPYAVKTHRWIINPPGNHLSKTQRNSWSIKGVVSSTVKRRWRGVDKMSKQILSWLDGALRIFLVALRSTAHTEVD